MPLVVLVHEAGPDRDALAAYLEKAGHKVDTLDPCELDDGALPALDGSAGKGVIVARESVLGEHPDSLAADLPLLVIGNGRPLAGRPRIARVPEPYDLSALAREVDRLASGGPSGTFVHEARPEGSADVPESSEALLLSGLSHAIRNPLTSAMGWLQLLMMELPEQDPRRRPLRQVAADLQRLERMTLALNMIAGRKVAMGLPLALDVMLNERIRQLENEGLTFAVRAATAELPKIIGDPNAYELLFDLLLGSFVPDRSRTGRIHVGLEVRGGAVEIRLSDEGGTINEDVALADLGQLLGKLRYGRALAVALARTLTAALPGGEVRFEAERPDAPGTLVLRLPAQAGPAS